MKDIKKGDFVAYTHLVNEGEKVTVVAKVEHIFEWGDIELFLPFEPKNHICALEDIKAIDWEEDKHKNDLEDLLEGVAF